MVLYINCANHAPGVKFGHAPGVDSLHRPTIGKKLKKSSSLKPLGQQLQSNLDNSNADFSKLPDFSETSDGPEMFLYCLLLKYY